MHAGLECGYNGHKNNFFGMVPVPAWLIFIVQGFMILVIWRIIKQGLRAMRVQEANRRYRNRTGKDLEAQNPAAKDIARRLHQDEVLRVPAPQETPAAPTPAKLSPKQPLTAETAVGSARSSKRNLSSRPQLLAWENPHGLDKHYHAHSCSQDPKSNSRASSKSRSPPTNSGIADPGVTKVDLRKPYARNSSRVLTSDMNQPIRVSPPVRNNDNGEVSLRDAEQLVGRGHRDNDNGEGSSRHAEKLVSSFRPT